MTFLSPVTSQPPNASSHDVRELISMATTGLVPMFDAGKNVFCHRLLRTEHGLVQDQLSPRYTIMTLLGLRELELAGIGSSFDTRRIYTAFARDTNWIQGIGDLGLFLWLTAIFDPANVDSVLAKFECDQALDRYADARARRTMELAWFLAGLAHAAETSPRLVNSLTDLSVETYHRIEGNQGDYGFFGHMGVKNSLAGRLRGRIGSFADQVYPIYALSRFAKAFQVEDPVNPALECASAICGAQGDLGQWWWLYDSHAGRTSSRYPVYAVHQHGMAPMALFAVEEATGQSFRQFIYKGLHWIYGANELGVDMRDTADSLVWRCIMPKKTQSKYWEMATSLVRTANGDSDVGALKVLYEQRPYEYGWLIFAFAKHTSSPTA
jgi:hypothetical protein